MDENWARRGSSFGAAAAEYAELRPEYPEEAVRWCVAPLGRGGGGEAGRGELASLRVLDLGAGTGKLTALLLALGADVTAVEPDPAMLAELRRGLPSANAVAGSAEQIPLDDASVDAVLCGQSMHWFNMPLAVPEIARVLIPGGTLSALWNSDDDRVGWVAGLRDAAKGASSPSLSRRRLESAGFGADEFGTELFAPTDRAEFPNAQRMTADKLVATMATHSQFLIMEPGPRAELLGEVRAYLASRPETATGEFNLPLVTSVARSVRR